MTHQFRDRDVGTMVTSFKAPIGKPHYYSRIGMMITGKLAMCSIGEILDGRTEREREEMMAKMPPEMAIFALLGIMDPRALDDISRDALQSVAIILSEHVFNPGQLEEILRGRREMREQGVSP